MPRRPRSPEKLRPINLVLSERQIDALYELSGKENRSMSDIVRGAVASYIEGTGVRLELDEAAAGAV